MTPDIMDFGAWVRRARAFMDVTGSLPGMEIASRRVSRPLDRSRMEMLARSLRRPVVPVLARFLATGSGGLQCRYVFEPDGAQSAALDELFGQSRIYGGPTLCIASELVEYSRSVKDWISDSWIAEDREQKEIWSHSFPFAALDNGDFLALDVTVEHDDPPVLYLDHEGPSVELSRSFSAFLATWEGLGYIGPEIWLLGPFVAEDGRLSAEVPAARRLREIFDTSRS
jgi:hypothetical protein